MKRYSKIIATAMAALTIATGIAGAATMAVGGVSKVNYNFVINDNAITLPNNYLVMSKNGTTYVPLRFISETLGAKVDYSQGTIRIAGGSSAPSKQEPITQTEKQKLESALRELDLIKKENARLQNRLTEMEKQYTNVSAYNKLPVGSEDTFGLKIRVDDVTASGNEKAVFNVTITNNNKDNLFNLIPEKTKLTVGSKVYDVPTDYTATFSSSLVHYTKGIGLSSITGDISYDGAYDKNLKGALTFYYRVNNGADERSMTLYFDASK